LLGRVRDFILKRIQKGFDVIISAELKQVVSIFFFFPAFVLARQLVLLEIGKAWRYSFKIRSGPAGRPGIRRIRDWNRVGLKKIGKGKIRCDPVDPVKNPVATR
jgi:hypothetical protein